MQTHRGWTRDGARSGLTLQQGLHQQQFDNVLLIWELVRPLVAPFSLVLQDLERSSNSSELELGLLRTVAGNYSLQVSPGSAQIFLSSCVSCGA